MLSFDPRARAQDSAVCTQTPLSLSVYAEICGSVFPRALGKYYSQPLILPKQLVFVPLLDILGLEQC